MSEAEVFLCLHPSLSTWKSSLALPAATEPLEEGAEPCQGKGALVLIPWGAEPKADQ